jgi:hypothetical protein
LIQRPLQIQSVVDQLKPLQNLHQQLQTERSTVLAQIDSLSTSRLTAPTSTKGKNKAIGSGIDYMAGSSSREESFEWTAMMKRKMRQVWGIQEFRWALVMLW